MAKPRAWEYSTHSRVSCGFTVSAFATTGLMLSGFCARPRYVAEVMRMGLLAGVMADPVPGLFT